MIIHARTIASLAMAAAVALGCSTSEIAGAPRPHDSGKAAQPSTALLTYTPPRVLTDIPHAPLRTMGGAYASTEWASTTENQQLLQELLALKGTPETIHTTTHHLYRTMTVTAGCADDRTTSVSHDTWCDYVIDNPTDEPYTVGATTTHQYRHTVGGMLSRSSASREREYRPSTADTIAKKDSVQDPEGTSGNLDPTDGGGSGETTWTICWEYYELDLTTNEITLLFTTCPVSPGGTPEGTQSLAPADRSMQVRSDSARGTRLVGVSALLVQVPALPNGARIAVRRMKGAKHPYLILGVPGASDDEWAGGIEVLMAVVRRDGPDAPPAMFALGRSSGRARPEVRERVAAMCKRMKAASRREISGYGLQRAVPLALFVEH